MIYITQLIYLFEGKQHDFNKFEEDAIPLISKYKGRLLLRVKPDARSILENNIDIPYEIHLIEFATDADLEHFMRDEERKKVLYLKEASVKSTLLVKGAAL